MLSYHFKKDVVNDNMEVGLFAFYSTNLINNINGNNNKVYIEACKGAAADLLAIILQDSMIL